MDRSWGEAARRRLPTGPWTPGGLVLAALMVVPASIGQLTPPSDDVRANQEVESMWGPLHRHLSERSTYLAVDGADAAFGVGPEIARRLINDGFTLRTSTFGADSYGDHRVLSKGRPADQTLELVKGGASLAPPD